MPPRVNLRSRFLAENAWTRNEIFSRASQSEARAWFSNISRIIAGYARPVFASLLQRADFASLTRIRKIPSTEFIFPSNCKSNSFFFYFFISGILVGSPTGRVFLSAECIAGQLRPMFQLKNVQYCMRKRKQTHIHILVFMYQFYSSHCPKKQKAHVTFVLGFNPSKLQNFPTNRVEKFINFSDKCKCAFSLFLCQNKH